MLQFATTDLSLNVSIDWAFLTRCLSAFLVLFGSRLGLSWRWLRTDSIALIFEALLTFRDLRSKDDVLELEMEGVPVGTLIYDTYLRRYRQETLQTRSWRLLWITIQAQVIVRRTQQYFRENQVVLLIPGDVAYIYSGIVARAAILKGIPTYSVVEIPCRLAAYGFELLQTGPILALSGTVCCAPPQKTAHGETASHQVN